MPKIVHSCEPACMAVRADLQTLKLMKLGVTYKECVNTGEKLHVLLSDMPRLISVIIEMGYTLLKPTKKIQKNNKFTIYL